MMLRSQWVTERSGTGRCAWRERQRTVAGGERRWILAVALLAAVCLGPVRAPAQQPPGAVQRQTADVPAPPEGMSFSTQLDHTAVWVGDQFHYLIIVDYTADYEFVLENLSRDNINMEPFQVVDVSWNVTERQEGSQRLFLDVVLTSFLAGQESEQIPQLTLFYFRRGARGAGPQESAAESLTIPGPVVALRSTLPPSATDIRDAITVSGWESARWMLPVAGWVCLILLVAGAGWETSQYVRGRKSSRGPDRRKAMEALRGRWAQGVPADFTEPQTVMDFCSHSYNSLKEYMGYYLETPTMGLTAEELQEEMQRGDANPELTGKVFRVLDQLEKVRYSVNGAAPPQEAARNIVQDIRLILDTTSKQK